MPEIFRRYDLGTASTQFTQVLPDRSNLRNRSLWRIVMRSTSIDSGNSGRVHYAKGFVPSTTIGDPNCGLILLAGGQNAESRSYPGDQSVWQGEVWAVGSAANQIIEVTEVLD